MLEIRSYKNAFLYAKRCLSKKPKHVQEKNEKFVAYSVYVPGHSNC